MQFIDNETNCRELKVPVLLASSILLAINIDDSCTDMNNIGPNSDKNNVRIVSSIILIYLFVDDYIMNSRDKYYYICII